MRHRDPTSYRYRVLAYICRPPCIREGLASEGFTSLGHILRRRPDACRWAVAIHLTPGGPASSEVVALDLYEMIVEPLDGRVSMPPHATRTFLTTEAAETFCVLNYDAAPRL